MPLQLPNQSDPVLRLERRIKQLEKQVAILQADARPTIPIYTPSHLADLPEQNDGEYWINTGDGKLYYQFGGTDIKVTSA